MATYSSAKRNTSGVFDSGDKKHARVVDFILDFSADVTMTTATDTINLATLPAGTLIMGVSVQQITAGTGTGTVVARSGTTTLTGTLASTATANTWAATVPAAIPYMVPAGGEELNLLGATATRLDGKVRVTVVMVEAAQTPTIPVIVGRDATL